MKPILSLVIAALIAAPALAQEGAEPDAGAATEILMFDAGDVNLSDFLWIKRPVVVFADSPADPRFGDQITLLTERAAELEERDVVVLTDTDPGAMSPLREKLRPRGFMLVLIGKDGQVKLRKPEPWDVRELTRVIDKMPMRQREIHDRRLETTADTGG